MVLRVDFLQWFLSYLLMVIVNDLFPIFWWFGGGMF